MNQKRKQTFLMIALAIALITLPACPPEESGVQQIQAQSVLHDMKDFWPMAKGNYWHMLPATGDYQYFFEVVEDYSTGETEAWAVRYRAYDGKGDLVFDDKLYYIFHQELFGCVTDKDLLFQILDNPKEPLLYYGLNGNRVEIVAPRFFYDGLEPRDYRTAETGRTQYSIVGPLQEILINMVCGGYYDPAPPERYPVEAERQALVTAQDEFCGATPSIVGQALFARGVGPLEYKALTLIYANVGGVEYAL